MSCADVMYQPYTPYFPYQRPMPTATATATATAASPSELLSMAPYEVKAYAAGFQNWRGLGHVNGSPNSLHLSEGLVPLENLRHDLFDAFMARRKAINNPMLKQKKFGVPKLPEPMEQGSPDFVLQSSGGATVGSPVAAGTGGGGAGGSSSSSSSSASSVRSSTSRSSNQGANGAAPASVKSPAHRHHQAAPSSKQQQQQQSSCGGGGACAAASSSSSDVVKSEVVHATDAQYISANCVLFTYYSGDISAVVDEHFSRALSQSSFGDAAAAKGASHSKDSCPSMSQRNFPPSFWNSNYVTYHQGLGGHGHHGGSSELSSYASDPYHHHHHGLHHQGDPWHYPLSGSQGPYHAHRPSMHHELQAAYSSMTSMAPPSARFNPLLLQPPPSAMRSGRQCKAPGDPWGATPRYHHDDIAHLQDNYPSATHAYSMTGLEGPVQDTAKDLYWF